MSPRTARPGSRGEPRVRQSATTRSRRTSSAEVIGRSPRASSITSPISALSSSLCSSTSASSRWRSSSPSSSPGHQHLDVRAQARDRRAQLVRGVGHELSLRAHRLVERGTRALEALDHRVEARGKLAHLVVGVVLDPAREVLGFGDVLRGLGDLGQRREHAPCRQASEAGGERDPARAQQEQHHPQVGEDVADPVEGTRQLVSGDPDHAPNWSRSRTGTVSSRSLAPLTLTSAKYGPWSPSAICWTGPSIGSGTLPSLHRTWPLPVEICQIGAPPPALAGGIGMLLHRSCGRRAPPAPGARRRPGRTAAGVRPRRPRSRPARSPARRPSRTRWRVCGAAALPASVSPAARSRRPSRCAGAAARRPPRSCGAGSPCTRRARSTSDRSRIPTRSRRS